MKLLYIAGVISIAVSVQAGNYTNHISKLEPVNLSEKYFLESFITQDELKNILINKFEISEGDISKEDLRKLTYALLQEWNGIITFQYNVRREYRIIYRRGLCLGIYSEDFCRTYSNPKLITTFNRERDETNEQLSAILKDLNDRILRLVNEIRDGAVLLDEEGNEGLIKGLLEKKNKEWDLLAKLELFEGRKVSELVSHSGSLDEVQLTSWELGKDRVILAAWNAHIDSGKISFDSYRSSDEEYKKALGAFLIKNIGAFEGRIDRLQGLFEQRALVRAEQEMRKLEILRDSEK